MSGVDLAQWLTAQLAEDERIARRAGDSFRQIGETGVIVATEGDRAEECASANWAGVAEHIVEHDPARVLREIDGRRRTLVRCQEETLSGIPRLVHFAQQTLREMALGYSHRPGYAEAVASAD